MGWETPAKIMSSAFIGLGKPEPEFLQRHELEQILFERLAFYYEAIRSSDQNVMTKWTSEFTLTSTDNTKNLTSFTSDDILFPLWAERKLTTNTNTIWEFVPTVNLDSLAEERFNGSPAVSFYGETPATIMAAFSYYGGEVGTPLYTFRIRYQPKSAFSSNVDADHLVPDNLSPLIVADVKLHAVSILVNNASKYMKDRPELQSRIDGWTAIATQAQADKLEWQVHFERYVRRSRGAARGRNRDDILLGVSGGFIGRRYW